MLEQVEDIVVGFVEAKFVATCELLLGMPGLMINLGGLMGSWVVAVGLQAALFRRLALGDWFPLAGPRWRFIG